MKIHYEEDLEEVLWVASSYKSHNILKILQFIDPQREKDVC